MGVDFTYTQQEVDVLCKAYFEKGRADTLEEVISKVVSLHGDMVLRYGMNIVEARADAFDELKEWLKEQKNE